MSLTIWIIGGLFTIGLACDKDDPWWFGPVVVLIWPIIIGFIIRKVLEK